MGVGSAGSAGPSSTLSPPASFPGLKPSPFFHGPIPSSSILAARLGANNLTSSGRIWLAHKLASMLLSCASHGIVARLTEMSGKLQPTLASPGNGMGEVENRGMGTSSSSEL